MKTADQIAVAGEPARGQDRCKHRTIVDLRRAECSCVVQIRAADYVNRPVVGKTSGVINGARR